MMTVTTKAESPGRAADYREVAATLSRVDPRLDRALRVLLTGALGAAASDLGSRLSATVDAVTRDDVTLVFGGHFSSGKSTLLNELIGRDLLPTGDLPETGVPCVLTSGPSDQVVVVTDARNASLAFDTAAIAGAVSLVDGSGGYRTEVAAVRELAVRLAAGGPPARARWIDSPGINDTPSMNKRATEVARQADVLVWVVSSRQPMAEVEVAFLRRHVMAHGPSSVVFVVNVFLESDDPGTWARFVERRGAYFGARIADLLGESLGARPPEVVLVSARAAAGRPDGFGGPEVRALVARLSDVREPRVLRSRVHRAAEGLESLAQEAGDGGARERARVERARARRAEAGSRAEAGRGLLATHAPPAVERALARCVAVIEARTAALIADIDVTSLRRDGSYGAHMTREVSDAADALRRQITDEVDAIAAAGGRGSLSGPARRRVGELLHSGPIAITVPETPVPISMRGLNAVLGGVLGTIIAPGPGTAIGAGLGAAAGRGAGTRAAAAARRDREATVAGVAGAAWAASQELRAAGPAVLSVLLDPGATEPPVPPVPDTSTLAALNELALRLRLAATGLRGFAL